MVTPARRQYLEIKAQDRHDPEGGMHSTPTIDHSTVLSGAVWLRLDEGAEVLLTAGDCVIQRGTRRTWRNTGASDHAARCDTKEGGGNKKQTRAPLRCLY